MLLKASVNVMQAMAAELAALRTRDGEPYQLFALPWPQPIVDRGRRLAASRSGCARLL